MDAGLLVARLVFGLLMAAHGTQKLFGWFGGYGLSATAGSSSRSVSAPAGCSRRRRRSAEVASGLLLAVGLFGPVGPALIVSVMVVAAVACTPEWAVRASQRRRSAAPVRGRGRGARADRTGQLFHGRVARPLVLLDARRSAGRPGARRDWRLRESVRANAGPGTCCRVNGGRTGEFHGLRATGCRRRLTTEDRRPKTRRPKTKDQRLRKPLRANRHVSTTDQGSERPHRRSRAPASSCSGRSASARPPSSIRSCCSTISGTTTPTTTSPGSRGIRTAASRRSPTCSPAAWSTGTASAIAAASAPATCNG